MSDEEFEYFGRLPVKGKTDYVYSIRASDFARKVAHPSGWEVIIDRDTWVSFPIYEDVADYCDGLRLSDLDELAYETA